MYKTFVNTKEPANLQPSEEKPKDVSILQEELSDFYNEPYLKFLSENKGLNIKKPKS